MARSLLRIPCSPERAREFAPRLGSRLWAVITLSLLLGGVLLSGCSPDADSAPAKSAKKKQRGPHLVEVSTAARQPLRLSQVHTGSLTARRIVRIHTQEAGRITTLPLFEGDVAAEGALLLTLDRTLLETELARARALRREAEANLRRLRRLLKRKTVAEDEVRKAATALDVARAEEALLTTRLSYTTVVAPFTGVVSERLMEPGDIAERYQHVLTVLDPSSLVAELNVSELLIPHIRTGTPVTVRVDALGDRRFAGDVIRVHPGLDPVTRQGRVEIELDPTPEGARPGQFARVSFELQTLERLIVPFSALRRDDLGEYVYRLDDNDIVKRVSVRGGQRLADRIEILDGLSDGDRIVHRGFLGLSNGMPVKVVGNNRG